MNTRAFALAAVLLAAAVPAHAEDEVRPISPALCQSMRANRVINAGAPVDCARLALVHFAYAGFDGALHEDGQLVVLDAVADEVLAIFRELRAIHFPIRSARLMDAFGGSDDASMAVNNTSAFNHRTVEGRSTLSVHAYGCAIDINPVQNPYVTRHAGKPQVDPPAGSAYLVRTPQRAGMAEAAVRTFARHGFTLWGGRWRTETDYQHFAVDRALAQRLAALPGPDAKRLFQDLLQRAR